MSKLTVQARISRRASDHFIVIVSTTRADPEDQVRMTDVKLADCPTAEEAEQRRERLIDDVRSAAQQRGDEVIRVEKTPNLRH